MHVSYYLLVINTHGHYLKEGGTTMRSQGRTYQIANKLHHGEQLFEEKTT